MLRLLASRERGKDLNWQFDKNKMTSTNIDGAEERQCEAYSDFIASCKWEDGVPFGVPGTEVKFILDHPTGKDSLSDNKLMA